MSSLSRSPRNRSNTIRTSKLLDSQTRIDVMTYFGLKVNPDVKSKSPGNSCSPLRRSLYANSEPEQNELDIYEGKMLDKSEANRLIAEELACSPVRTSQAVSYRTAELGQKQEST